MSWVPIRGVDLHNIPTTDLPNSPCRNSLMRLEVACWGSGLCRWKGPSNRNVASTCPNASLRCRGWRSNGAISDANGISS